MRVVLVPCLQDNYAYLVICERTGQAAVVDPSEAGPVAEALAREGATLQAIWNTHHHWDHVGGNEQLVAAHPGIEVVGHRSDAARVPAVTHLVDEGDQVTVGDDITAQIIHNPGHTSGAISYHIAQSAVVFTGDTLFGAGCGRLFEGTPPVMYGSLMKLAALPDDTQVYCGHEYTAANLAFAAAVEPDNADVAARAADVNAKAGAPTVPSTMASECRTNPFLRAAVPAVARAARARQPDVGTDPAAVFGALRAWKDRFRG
jgi:hydroxyacylglutathione hydrolase